MTITAKYPGTCRKCGRAIKVGDQIEWQKGKGASHAQCLVNVPDDAIRLSGGSGYGCHGWQDGQVIRSGKRRIEAGGPEYLYVISASERYVRDDGMSCGVGDEEGYIYAAVCRAATDEEAAPVKARIAAAEQRKAATEELGRIRDEIKANGDRPDGDNQPEGERVSDTQNIYGGGDWFVVGPAHIWYVRNNGADGDDWQYNNVRTGGAGAIGWRVPYTTELDVRLRAAAETADRSAKA
jgi:hypothetical protein